MSRCTCGDDDGCNFVAGTGIILSGACSPTNPLIISAETNCDAVRGCLSDGDGINYNPATGQIQACLSTDAGNTAVFGTDDCIYVPAAVAPPVIGCGLVGDGTAGSPMRVDTNPWPYPCAVGTFGGVVACDPATGNLVGEPRAISDLVSTQFNRTYANILVPAGTTSVELDTFTVPLQNPDTCRPSRVYITREVEVWFTLPGTSSTGPSTAAYGIVNDETMRTFNNGATTVTNMHTQTSKTFKDTNLPAGAAGSYTLSVTGNSGTGGATYTQIEVTIRVLYIST